MFSLGLQGPDNTGRGGAGATATEGTIVVTSWGYDAGFIAGRETGYVAGRAAGWRAGVEAMRDAVANNWTPGIVYSTHTAQSFVDMCATRLLAEGEGGKKRE